MPSVDIQFGTQGRKIIRQFDVPPRHGEIVQISCDDQEFCLLIDTVLHFEAPDGARMHYHVHGQIITDLDALLEQQAVRAREGR